MCYSIGIYYNDGNNNWRYDVLSVCVFITRRKMRREKFSFDKQKRVIETSSKSVCRTCCSTRHQRQSIATKNILLCIPCWKNVFLAKIQSISVFSVYYGILSYLTFAIRARIISKLKMHYDALVCYWAFRGFVEFPSKYSFPDSK